MKLSYIKYIGRYKNTKTGQMVNIRQGRNTQRGTDLLFYLYKGSRVFISDMEFYSEWQKIEI